MVIVEKNKINELLYIDFLYEYQNTKDKLSLFEKKYSCKFEEFEKNIKQASEEDFEKWDDYMEWKAFHKSFLELEQKKMDYSNGNIKIA